MTYITATMMYDWIQCPHRVSKDLFGNEKEKDEISPFVKLLWEKGHAYESEVVSGMDVPFTDLSKYAGEEKESETLKAIERGDCLIYSGRIKKENLLDISGILGIPDLLQKSSSGYIAGDIKSGAGLERGSDLEDGKPKKHYALQLALYSDILKQLEINSDENPFILDIHGDKISYDLEELIGKKSSSSYWDLYYKEFEDVNKVVAGELKTRAALSSACKLCHWRSGCRKEIDKSRDLTLISELGFSKRETLFPIIKTIDEFSEIDPGQFYSEYGKYLSGIGEPSIIKFQQRASLLMNPESGPKISDGLNFPDTSTELFFDVETDPFNDICYLHGFYVRKDGEEKYIVFFADNPSQREEEEIFGKTIDFIRNNKPWVMYYYSKYERTIFRKLQEKYPNVVSAEEIEEIFDPFIAIDLYYDVVRKHTEWPTNDYSLKTLAKYIGFDWRDTDPSGASSIEWYHRWIEQKDSSIKQRILDYNEDDCKATMVLLDGIKKYTK